MYFAHAVFQSRSEDYLDEDNIIDTIEVIVVIPQLVLISLICNTRPDL